jgi:hypothetical protein
MSVFNGDILSQLDSDTYSCTSVTSCTENDEMPDLGPILPPELRPQSQITLVPSSLLPNNSPELPRIAPAPIISIESDVSFLNYFVSNFDFK